MKIIFLDIDGVLNHEAFYTERHEKMKNNETLEKANMELCAKSIAALNYITDKTGAKIVITSTWRLGTKLAPLAEKLVAAGVTGDIIGKTPFLQYLEFEGQPRRDSIPRGCEIQEWIRSHEEFVGPLYQFTEYVILDDDSDMLYRQRNNFIKVDKFVGLTYGVAFQAVHILDGHKIMNTNEL